MKTFARRCKQAVRPIFQSAVNGNRFVLVVLQIVLVLRFWGRLLEGQEFVWAATASPARVRGERRRRGKNLPSPLHWQLVALRLRPTQSRQSASPRSRGTGGAFHTPDRRKVLLLIIYSGAQPKILRPSQGVLSINLHLKSSFLLLLLPAEQTTGRLCQVSIEGSSGSQDGKKNQQNCLSPHLKEPQIKI